LYGGNSNWRGPVWMPMNYMLILALEQYAEYYGKDFTVEMPVGSGRRLTLSEVSTELARRLINIFRPDKTGRRPVHGEQKLYQADPFFGDLVLFYEYFDGDTSRGMGASHQTGWTGIIAELINRVAGTSALR
jgi:hypothetical protein